ncbi:hypothetical protein R6Q59_012685 [Mikania micrantha]
MSLNHQIDGDFKPYEDQNDQKKVFGYGTRVKRVVLSIIKSTKKRLQRGKSNENQSLGFCCWCVGRTPSVDSSAESPTSDPNSSGFGFDSLRGLIEKSDFLLNDCNTHLELDVHISDNDDDDDDHHVVD